VKRTERHRDGSLRLKQWDYTWKASYFVTANCKGRAHHFGEVIEGEMQLSDLGQIADTVWSQIHEHYPWAQPGPHIIMPDHMHGIITLVHDHTAAGSGVGRGAGSKLAINREPTAQPTADDDDISDLLKPAGGITGQHNPMLLKSLGRIMRWYKGRVSYEARKIEPSFAWQSRYYEHIIRHPAAYSRIARYIELNPQRWTGDSKNASSSDSEIAIHRDPRDSSR